jgi:xylulokinase
VNASRVLTATAALLGVDIATFDRLALEARPGAGGLTLLPYLDGERTPNRPAASGVLRGLTSSNATPANLARAAVEAVLCSLADAIDHLTACGITARQVTLIGGAARSPAVRAIAPAVFGLPVSVPAPAEYVALGAARQAAWARSGALPDWPVISAAAPDPAEPEAAVRDRYAELREATAGWRG